MLRHISNRISYLQLRQSFTPRPNSHKRKYISNAQGLLGFLPSPWSGLFFSCFQIQFLRLILFSHRLRYVLYLNLATRTNSLAGSSKPMNNLLNCPLFYLCYFRFISLPFWHFSTFPHGTCALSVLVGIQPQKFMTPIFQ